MDYCKLELEAELAELLNGQEGPIYGEAIFNKIVLRAWEKGAIDSLRVTKDQFSEILESFGWNYDKEGHYWTRSPNQKYLF